MKLHRVGKQADWKSIPVAKRNAWQQIAAKTHGVVTPGNVVTIIGAVLIALSTLALVEKQYWTALLLIGFGRLCDLIDGWLAEKTGTKSRTGEILDATVDKIAVLFIVLVIIATAVAPWWLVLVLLAVQLLISWQGAINYLHVSEQHAARSGKISMAALWLSLLAFILAQAWQSFHAVGLVLGYGLAAVSIYLGVVAFRGYFAMRKHT